MTITIDRLVVPETLPTCKAYKTNGQMCGRRASYRINGETYCEPHAGTQALHLLLEAKEQE